MISRALRYLRRHGLKRTALRVYRLVVPERVPSLSIIRGHLRGTKSLEVGGPTLLFQAAGLIPVYRSIASADNVNFSTQTIWEGELEDAGVFTFDDGRRHGTQFVREASNLSGIENESYDTLLNSHVLEHSANPLAVLNEWKRVLRPGGKVLTVMPHREGTFDHRRAVTPLRHLKEDFDNGTGEDDLTHLAEILSLHDLTQDPGANPDTFEKRSRDNFINRCLHQHVFDTRAVLAMLDCAGLDIITVDVLLPYHICVLARKPLASDGPVDNRRWLDPSGRHFRHSPFASDRASENSNSDSSSLERN